MMRGIQRITVDPISRLRSEFSWKQTLTFPNSIPWIIIFTYFVFGVVVILKNPIQIGGDENMEFSKAVIVARSPGDIPKVWNDQPWFYSCVWGHLFRLTGFCAAIPRMFSLLCCIIFCGGIRRLMPGTSSPFHHAIAIVLFLMYPNIITLSLSAMCELPATLLALLGATTLFQSDSKPQLSRLFSSGAMTGLAMQIKLTVGMVLIAATGAVMVHCLGCILKHGKLEAARTIAYRYVTWMLGVLVAFGIIALITPHNSWELLWESHSRAGRSIPSDLISNYRLSIKHLEPVASIGFLFGTLWTLLRRSAGREILPIVYGIVAMAIHAFHVPFYGFEYSVHFAAAFAPIAGWCTVEFMRYHCRSTEVESHALGEQPFLATRAPPVIVVTLCLCVVVFNSYREFGLLHQLQWTKHDPGVRVLQSFAAQINWGFGFKEDCSRLAQSGIVVIPELAVVSLNRVWAGYIRDEEILAIVMKYHPEAITFSKFAERGDPLWDKFLQSNYTKVLDTGVQRVYVASTIQNLKGVSVH